MSTRIGGAGGYAHWQKHRQRREPMPCAIAIGAAPVVIYTGPQNLAMDLDEMAVAGALAGTPIRTAKARTVDLNVPADAEIVIEGFIDPELLEPEGPFGESHGHVALEGFNLSMQVTAITHRRNAVFASIISQVTPSESSVIKKVAYEPVFLNHLRNYLGISGVRRVVMHEPLSNIRPVIFIQIANGTPKTEVWRALHGCSSRFADCGKNVIAVSEDIDPSNTDAVFWSLAYRSNPSEDLHVQPYRSAGHGPKSGPRDTDSSLLIDATMKHPMPPLALPAREFMERAVELWRELALGPLALRPPWYGYQLGDWSESWTEYARNAATGDWVKNGEKTFARRRGGITPETPVRMVEGANALPKK
jgi:4-hydroxy-3-polyprenylbenzoate decarboxylase